MDSKPSRIFISWSGAASRIVANGLRDLIKEVSQATDPWTSDKDIASGVDWYNEIGDSLRECTFAVVCVTPDNWQKPWVNFEAGAVAFGLSEGDARRRVTPYLLGMKKTDLQGPLVAFQAQIADRDGTLSLIQDINKTLGAFSRQPPEVARTFDTNWPEMEQALGEARKTAGPKAAARAPATAPRDDASKLDEVLELLRYQSRGNARDPAADIDWRMRRVADSLVTFGGLESLVFREGNDVHVRLIRPNIDDLAQAHAIARRVIDEGFNPTKVISSTGQTWYAESDALEPF